MMRYIHYLAPALAMGLLLGCGEGESRVTTPEGAIAVYEAPAETVVAQFGDTKITVGDLRRRLEFETGIYAYGMRHAKKQVKEPEKTLAVFRSQREQQALPQLVHCALLKTYLSREGLELPAEEAEKAVAKTVRSLARGKGKVPTAEAFAGEIGVSPGYFREQVLVDAQEQMALRHFDPDCEKVSDQEIEADFARIDAYVARAVASNRVTWATCSNVLAQVKAGADFTTIGRKFGAEDSNEATEWGWFNRDDFDMMAKRCPAFTRWAFSAKVGDIGGPFDVDDGLSIVKVVGRQEGSEKPSLASKQAEEVQLVRINFLMAEEHPEPRTRDYCKNAVRMRKKFTAQKKLFEGLFNSVKITYPNGDKLDFRRTK